MKKILIIISAILLTACNDQQQIISSYKWMVVHPSESMYYCPVLKEFPDWRKLTDAQVAKTVLLLYKNNLTCKSSIESIKEFLAQEEKRLGD